MKRLVFVLLFLVCFIYQLEVYAVEPPNENTAVTLKLTTKDKDDAEYTAAKITYRLDDVISGTQIKDDTDVTPTSAITEITVPALNNIIINDSLSYEEKRLSFQVYVGSTVVYSGEYRYKIKNLIKIPL